MNNATNRPDPRDLAAGRYEETARADRRAAVAQRRAERAAGIETSVEQNARLFKNAGS
jgi:hypothetical protein